MTYRLRLSLALGFLAVCLLGSLALAKAVGIHDPPPPERCMNNVERERSRSLVLAGLDDALKSYVLHLYDNWLRDQDEHPIRAAIGLRAAINAHSRARGSMLSWNPPEC